MSTENRGNPESTIVSSVDGQGRKPWITPEVIATRDTNANVTFSTDGTNPTSGYQYGS